MAFLLNLFTADALQAQGKFTVTFSETLASYGSATITTDTMGYPFGAFGMTNGITGDFRHQKVPSDLCSAVNSYGSFTIYPKTRITGIGTYSCEALLKFCPNDIGDLNVSQYSYLQKENTLVLTITEFDSIAHHLKGTLKGSWLSYTSATGAKDYFSVDASFDYHPALVDLTVSDANKNPLTDTLFVRAGDFIPLHATLKAETPGAKNYYYGDGSYAVVNTGDGGDSAVSFISYYPSNCNLDSAFTEGTDSLTLGISNFLASGTYTLQLRARALGMGSAAKIIIYVQSRYELTTKCHGVRLLTFDASANTSYTDSTIDGWQNSAFTSFRAKGLVTLNKFLKFKGEITVDTATNDISYSGMWYCDIPMPISGKVSRFVLDSSRNKKGSASCDIIFKPLNLAIDEYISSKIAGFKFRTDSIDFISGPTPKEASGIRLGCTIKIPTLPDSASNECKNSEDGKNNEISLAPLELTDQGIGGRLEIKNINLYPRFCLNQFFISYYSQPDSLDVGADIKTPFFDKLAISAGILKGAFNALGFEVSLAKSIPIAQTGLGIKGIKGSMTNWSSFPLKFSFEGTVNAVAEPSLMELKVGLGYEEPSKLIGTVTGNLFKTGSVWQGDVSVTSTLDWQKYFELKGSMKLGNLGTKNDYVFDATGNLKYTWNPVSSVDGSLNGVLKIPKIGFAQNVATDFINRFLPITLGRAEALLKDKRIRANVELRWFLTAHFACDLNLSILDPGFIDFGYGAIKLQSAHEGGKNRTLALNDYYFTAAKDAGQIFIRIKSEGAIPGSYLLSPSGKKIAATISDSSVIYLPDSAAAFWYLLKPESGKWTLHLDNPSPSDSVNIEGYLAERSLGINAVQNGREVTVTWDTAGSSSNSMIDLYLDNNKSGLDGIHIGGVHERDGEFHYLLSDSLPGCEYYVYALRDDRGGLQNAYANTLLSIDKPVAQPINVRAGLGNQSITIVRWDKPSYAGIARYVVRVINDDGSDSVYISVGPNSSMVGLSIISPETKKISVAAYTTGGEISCWTYPVSIASSSVKRQDQSTNRAAMKVTVYPNPSSGSATVTFATERRQILTIDLFDALGRKLTTFANQSYEAGDHALPIDLRSFEDGTYYIRIQSSGEVETAKILVVR